MNKRLWINWVCCTACKACGAAAGYPCRSPKGRVRQAPHDLRGFHIPRMSDYKIAIAFGRAFAALA